MTIHDTQTFSYTAPVITASVPAGSTPCFGIMPYRQENAFNIPTGFFILQKKGGRNIPRIA